MGDQRTQLRQAADGHRKEAAALDPERQELDRRLGSLERPIGEATAKLDAAKAELDAAKRSLNDAREGHSHRQSVCVLQVAKPEGILDVLAVSGALLAKTYLTPVLGDRRYGSKINAPRLMLHAWKIEHADLGTIEAPMPAEFL